MSTSQHFPLTCTDVSACKSTIQVDDVTIEPRAPLSVRFASLDFTSSNKSPTYWIFRAKLSDGSEFAIDPCNAQYSFTSAQERNCGVFSWQSYLNRLSITVSAISDIQDLRSHAPKRDVYPVGSIKDGEKDVFIDADFRSTAELMASSSLAVACGTLRYKTKSSLKQLMARSLTQREHAEHVSLIKNHFKLVIDLGRARGVKNSVLERLHHKE